MKIARRFIAFSLVAMVGLAQLPVSAAVKSIISRNDIPAPQYGVITIFENDANDPDAYTRYEGVPNLIATGTTGVTSFYKLEEGNYCTRIQSKQGDQSYINFFNSLISSGTFIIEMDYAQNMKNSASFELFGFSDEGKNALKQIFYFSDSGKLVFIDPIKQENIVQENAAKYTSAYPTGVPKTADDECWIHIKVEVDIDARVFDIYFDDLIVVDDASIPENFTAIKGWRVTQRYNSTRPSAYVYLDNYYIGYAPRYNIDLTRQSVVMWENSDSAVVKRIPIKVNRYNPTVSPIKENDVLYIPLQFVADCRWAKVSTADGITNVKYGNIDAQVTPGSSTIKLNGLNVQVDAPPITRNGVTFVSAETVSKLFNTNIYYENDKIIITDTFGITEDDFKMMFDYWGSVR